MAGDSTTQITTTQPFGAQKSALTNAFGLAENLFSQGPLSPFPGSTVAEQSGATIQGQNSALGVTGLLSALGAQGGNAASMFLDPNSITNAASMAALDPNSAQSQALIAPMIANLQSQILPSIGSNAIQQGAFGGDRQAISEQQAAEGVAGAASNAVLQNQLLAQQGLVSNMGLGISSMPGVTQQLLEPARVLSEVGGQQDARNQALTDAAVSRFEFEQNAPAAALNTLISQISGNNLGGITNTTTSGGDGGGGMDIATLLGLGLAGHSLFSGGGA